MSTELTSLTEEHVRQLGKIVETLEKSNFDFLQIEVGDMKVTVGKGAAVPAAAGPTVAPVASAPTPSVAARAPAPLTTPTAAPAATSSAPAGSVEVVAPLMGMFYAQPEPGAPPFVSVGDIVAADDTVALVEVMKTFNSIPAGVAGKVVEICVSNAQLVEYGQVLIRILPQ